MNGVLGMNELLLGTKMSEQQRRFAETVKLSGESLLDIINDILDFSKIEAGRLTLDESEFDLRDLIEDTAELFAARAAEKKLELTCFIPQNMPSMVVSDSTRLRQVLSNILGNALKFTETGEVYVGVEVLDTVDRNVRLKFEVRDSGIGMSHAQVAKVFESFTQADSSTTRKYGGTGLGLTISQRIVELMGGQLEVQSVSGEGSTFTFDLLVKLAEDSRMNNEIRAIANMNTMHVLVVDDNATNLEIVSHHLAAWQISHDCVLSARQALDALSGAAKSGKPYTQVILDYHMPEMDGIRLARLIKADEKIASTRLVLFSSIDDIEQEEKYKEIGIDHAIRKPVRQADLYNCLMAKQECDYVNKKLTSNPTEANRANHEMRILVVEDNPVNQAVAVGMLETLGYQQIGTAGNGLEGLEALKSESYDLVLMDMRMPVMDGYKAMAVIREAEAKNGVAKNKRLPIVSLTANALQGDRDKCIEAGADEYLSKPFTPDQLANAVQTTYSCCSEGRATHHTKAENDRGHNVSADDSNGFVSSDPIEAMQTQSVLDESVLDTLRSLATSSQPDLFVKIINTYLESSLVLMEQLIESDEVEDIDRITHASHTLKSSSANVGAIELSQLCGKIEAMARSENMVGYTDVLNGLKTMYPLVCEELSSLIKSDKAA